MQIVMERIGKPWQQIDFIYNLTANYKRQVKCQEVLEGFTRELIRKKKIMMEEERNSQQLENNSNRKSLLELMIEFSGGENGYDDIKLLEEILMLIIGGTDTTTSTTGFICVMLSLYEEVQEKACKEIFSVLGKAKDITMEHLDKLVYLGAVIRETMRLYPSGPVIFRECDKDWTLPSGVSIPQGAALLINILGINQNPHYWGSDAKLFRPERFLEGAPTNPSAFMSFSYGPRNCAGQNFGMMSMKILISCILRRYRITPATCYRDAKQVETAVDVILRPVHDFKLRLEPRV